MAGIDVGRIADMTRATRATEKYKGSWLDMTAAFRGFPLVQRFFKKRVERIADRIKWRIALDPTPAATMSLEGFHVGAYSQVQTTGQENLKELDMKLAKVRKAMSISADEIELNGVNGTGEQLVDIFNEKKVHSLDQPLLTKLEVALGGSWSAISPTIQETCGLRYWLPANTSATTLSLNGGGNPKTLGGTEITVGAANMPVATAPRYASATCGFNKVSDDDLFGKIWEFRQRCNTFVPDGASAINSNGQNRIILCQTPVMKDWVHIQTIANDNPGRDIGKWRDSANFMSSEVMTLPVIDTLGSPLYTGAISAYNATAHGLLYDLDLDSFDYMVHAAERWNFSLQRDDKESTPDVEVLYRQAYHQLACKSRETNLVAATTNSSLYGLS